jgi:UDP-GlcNAc:undecaprenyl-phosphate GlcNAc-1-phosphate transferase
MGTGMTSSSVLPVLIAASVCCATLLALMRWGRLPRAHPNTRSLHDLPVPKGGGLALWTGWLAGTAWLQGPQPWLAPLLAIAIVSFWDDRAHVPAAARLVVHASAAAAWLWLAESPIPPLIAILAIVWMANLYNFMDGSDGLALAAALIGFGSYAVAACTRDSVDAIVLWALVAAVAPCLAVNAPPAKIFLGDVGAVPLGFLAAVFGMSGWSRGVWPVWFPILVFLPFIADATVTLVSRILRGATIWEAHREHFYQKLVLLGWGHRGTLVFYGGLMIGCAASALLAAARAPAVGPALLVLWIGVLTLLFAAIEYYWALKAKQFDESKH